MHWLQQANPRSLDLMALSEFHPKLIKLLWLHFSCNAAFSWELFYYFGIYKQGIYSLTDSELKQSKTLDEKRKRTLQIFI